MATYKVIQDIEAEDKILGPLTLRQFIYALLTCFFLYLCFIAIHAHASYFLVVLLPPTIFTGFFAAPFGRDQPTEVWAVAKIGFFFKPRKRVWDQSGIKELVTITVPKKIERVYTNGLSQTEVNSRLAALANTIDSRGWAIKNINVNMFAQPSILQESDRLVSMSSMPQQVVDYDVKASDDMLDEQSNPIAQQFTQMITASAQAHRQQIIDTMNGAGPQPTTKASAPADMWFTARSIAAPQTQNPVIPQVLEPATAYAPASPAPATPTAEEIALLDQLKAENSTDQTYNQHMKTIQPLSAVQPPAGPHTTPAPILPPPVVPSQPSPVIQNLSRSNDLNIATLAREASKSNLNSGPDKGEVVISLR